MTQFNITLNMDFLKESVMDSDMEAIVKSTVVLILNEFMEKERDDYVQAKAYERIDARKGQRNGYYERDLTLTIGRVTLRVPRTRDGEFSTTLFEKYSRMDQALVLSLMEMVVQGVSTRKVTHIVEQLCGQKVSKSFVSSLMEKLDPVIEKWSNRSLADIQCPYLFVDAMYIKVRENGRVLSKAVYIATTLSMRQRREIIGYQVSDVESYEAWKQFFQSLKERGLGRPKLVISDAHEGLKKAIQTEFQGTAWQRCTVHFKRNLIQSLPKKDTEEFRAGIKRIFQSLTEAEARERYEELEEKFEGQGKYEKALAILENGFEDAIQYLQYPPKMHVLIHSTNALERLNQEVRRRERVIRIFPNNRSATRLIGAILMDKDEEYALQRGITVE
ncbi:IS256 family transposase [Lysinibacillus agricola]|uniref:Mutator family transposase n=1 Tax=Lysinibacillus agricola TaxID=2590012 RepID=A0ABX7AVJ1_9BACI|nr:MULTISPECIES: IS256 family transposase [Lysinibacillus]KOS62058.1 transposase [Lysinibacillus sp. FJAT-14222]QQP13992.1 IS256 family transposase [Lysinibacillus agricola]